MSDRQPHWPEWLERHVARITGPEDDWDPDTNSPDSLKGEEDESGFDEMSPELGWEDESDENEDDGEDEAEDC